MTAALRIRREAERDIEDAAAWYEQQQSGLGQAFLDELPSALQHVAEQPDMYPVVHRDTPPCVDPTLPVWRVLSRRAAMDRSGCRHARQS